MEEQIKQKIQELETMWQDYVKSLPQEIVSNDFMMLHITLDGLSNYANCFALDNRDNRIFYYVQED